MKTRSPLVAGPCGVKILRLLSAAAALLLFPIALSAQDPAADEELPTGTEIIERSIEVSGGKEAFAKLNNRVVEGTMEIKGLGIKGKLVTYQARPNKTYTKIEIQGVGIIEQGTDGKVVWELNVMTGPRIKQGEEKAALLLLLQFDDTAFAELYEKIECAGTEEVQGEVCYKVVCTPKDAAPITTYYSKETGRDVKSVLTFPHQMGKIEVEIASSDYKEVDGVMLPHHSVEKVMHLETHVTITGCKHNVELPKDRFDLPPEIKTLLERAREEEAEKNDEQEAAAASNTET